MGVPDYQTLMLPLLKTVKDSEKDVATYVDDLTRSFKLSEEDIQQMIPSEQQTLIRNRAQWAATYLVKAGLLERPRRGVIRITEEGKQALESGVEKINNAFLMRYEKFQNFKIQSKQKNDNSQNRAPCDESSLTPEDLISSAYKEYEQTARQEILDLILNSSPLFFERLIIELFKSMGYGGKGKSTHMGKSGDGGIDGIINEDPLGLGKIYLQAKRYAPENKIQIDQIRSFSGTLIEQGASKGIFVTTSSFVKSAYEYTQKIPQSMILIDGQDLTKLMYHYDVGVRTVDIVKLKRPDMDFFEEL